MGRLGLGLIWLAPLVMGVMCYVSRSDLRVVHPLALVPACLWLMWPARGPVARTVQSVVFMYLMWILFAAGFESFWTSPKFGVTSLRVSVTIVPAILVGIGWLACNCDQSVPGRPGAFPTWALGAVIITLAVHCLFLVASLRPFYGFGWEEDGAVAGRIGLFIIVAIGLSPLSHSLRLRSSLAFLMAIVLVLENQR